MKSKPQKTVSFDQDIFDYIENNRDRFKFSDFANQLLSDQIKEIAKKADRAEKKALWVDEDTHTEFAIMAATRKMSIKQVVKELLEEKAAKNAKINK